MTATRGIMSVSVATLLSLAGCAGSSTAADKSVPSSGHAVRPSTAIPSARPTLMTAAPSSPAVAVAPRFAPGMVRAMTVTKKPKGGQANAAVVGGGTPEQLLEVGKGCVDHFRRQYKAAFCYVFASETDFAAATWNREEGLVDKCWVWYVGIPLAGGDYMPMQLGPGSYRSDGCPGKVYPPL